MICFSYDHTKLLVVCEGMYTYGENMEIDNYLLQHTFQRQSLFLSSMLVAGRNPQNQALIGSAGTLIKIEDFLVVGQGDLVEEEEFVLKDDKLALATDTRIDKVSKPQGMIIFFIGKRLTFLGLLCIFLWWLTLLLLINIFDHIQVIHINYI